MNLEGFLALILSVAFLVAFGIFFVSQSKVFLRDLRFYRSVKWDLSLDSGNKMMFLDFLRRSIFFKGIRVGRMRLSMGSSLFLCGLVLYAWMFLILAAVIAKMLWHLFAAAG